MEFPEAIVHILAAEGGYVCHPDDPGGETRYGITKRTARAHGYAGEMRFLPLGIAENIYRVSYWDACGCDLLPPQIRLAVFDAAVHSGVNQSVRWLQQALGIKPTGAINGTTLAALKTADPSALVKDLLDRRLTFLKRLQTWPKFHRGWEARLLKIRRLSQ